MGKVLTKERQHVTPKSVLFTDVREEMPAAYSDAVVQELREMHRYLQIHVKYCDNDHEIRVADYFTENAFYQLMTDRFTGDNPRATVEYERMVNCTLCTEVFRRNHPPCAHALKRRPDPFGPQIRRLIELRILQRMDWEIWLLEMSKKITENDVDVGRQRYTEQGRNPAWRREKQAPLIRELESTRIKLLHCVGTVLRSLGIVPETVSESSVGSSAVE